MELHHFTYRDTPPYRQEHSMRQDIATFGAANVAEHYSLCYCVRCRRHFHAKGWQVLHAFGVLKKETPWHTHTIECPDCHTPDTVQNFEKEYRLYRANYTPSFWEKHGALSAYLTFFGGIATFGAIVGLIGGLIENGWSIEALYPPLILVGIALFVLPALIAIAVVLYSLFR